MMLVPLIDTLHSAAIPWQMKIKALGSKLRGAHPQVNSLIPREFTINSCGHRVELEKVTNDRVTVFTSEFRVLGYYESTSSYLISSLYVYWSCKNDR
jgi:hypothetical protein